MMAKRTYKMKPKKPFPLYSCLAGTSLFFLLFGIILIISWPFLHNHIMSTSFVLTPNSKVYDVWKKNPFPLRMDFYFFNWTNPEDIYNDTIKPKLQQVGPYRFFETKEKANVTWNENNTVTYRHLKKWYFDEYSTGPSLMDQMVTLDAVALTASYTARDWSYILKKGLSLSLKSLAPTVHIVRTVNELLFEGYPDPLVSMAKKMPFLAGSGFPPWDRFGWFYKRNGSTEADGIFNMGTGIGNEFGRLYEWKYWRKTPFYKNECGNVEGSAGELFPQNLNKRYLSLFSSDICRNMKLDFVEEMTVKNILGYKYSADQSLFDNGSLVPENKCYCEGECVPSGALNVSTCRYGSPAFVSLPHFHNADSSYINAMEGLHSDKQKHEFFMILEPTTGVPLKVAARFQLNLLLQPISHVQVYENVPKVFFPVLWFEQVIQIPDEMVFSLRILINLPVICTSIAIVSICVGLVVMSCMIYKICTTNVCGKDSKKKDNKIFHEQMPLKSEMIEKR